MTLIDTDVLARLPSDEALIRRYDDLSPVARAAIAEACSDRVIDDTPMAEMWVGFARELGRP